MTLTIDAKTPPQRSTALAVMVLCAGGGMLPPSAGAGETGDGAPRLAVVRVAPEMLARAEHDPTDALWNPVPEQVVELTLAPATHPSIALHQRVASPAAASPLALAVRVASDGQRICFRLSWQDPTRDDHDALGAHRDAVAVQFPLQASPTSPMMGAPQTPVGIWYWKADTNGVEALTATGPGTLDAADDPSLRGTGVYAGPHDERPGEWSAVISQSLAGGGDPRVHFEGSNVTPVAFAVWQGSEGQRGGYKRVSGWRELVLEPAGAAR